MDKKINNWVLRYSKETVRSSEFRDFPSQTTDINKGCTVTLLRDKKIIERAPKKEHGEEEMPIPLPERYTFGGKAYSARYLKTAKDGAKRTEFSEQEWFELEMGQAIVSFAKRSILCSFPDSTGKEQNTNFRVEGMPYFILTNLDSAQEERSKKDVKTKELGYELTLMFKAEDKAEFNQVAYLMGMNPTGISPEMVYNILSDKITEEPFQYEKILTDPDRWLKIVINKALRTDIPESNPVQTYLVEKPEGQFNNYFYADKHIATGMDSLVGYIKDNDDVLSYLESELGLKKKELKEDGTSVKKQTGAKKQ